MQRQNETFSVEDQETKRSRLVRKKKKALKQIKHSFGKNMHSFKHSKEGEIHRVEGERSSEAKTFQNGQNIAIQELHNS